MGLFVTSLAPRTERWLRQVAASLVDTIEQVLKAALQFDTRGFGQHHERVQPAPHLTRALGTEYEPVLPAHGQVPGMSQAGWEVCGQCGVPAHGKFWLFDVLRFNWLDEHRLASQMIEEKTDRRVRCWETVVTPDVRSMSVPTCTSTMEALA